MTAITTTEVQNAARELQKMRVSLAAWLKYRELNDRVLAGTLVTKKPLAYAQQVVASARSAAADQDLANKLRALLSVVMPGQQLPSGVVQLAQLAIAGDRQVMEPTAQGGILSSVGGALTSGPGWLWPVLIVGALIVTVTTVIKTSADVAKDREHKACIMAGACTDYGFWLKVGGGLLAGWLVWDKFGGREAYRNLGKGARRR